MESWNLPVRVVICPLWSFGACFSSILLAGTADAKHSFRAVSLQATSRGHDVKHARAPSFP